MPHLRICEAATLLGVSDDTARRLAVQGRLSLMSREAADELSPRAGVASVKATNISVELPEA